MSRTFRRKNYEETKNNSWNTACFKTAGHYTEYHERVKTSNGHKGYCVYRPMTPLETRRRYWCFHGESKHSNARGPNRWYRKQDDKETDTHNWRQLQKWLVSLGEYDPVFIPKLVNFSDYNYW